jgi:hydrogenase-4 component E
MTETILFSNIVKILFVFVLGTAALVITRRTLSSLFTIYSIQSWFIAIIAMILYLNNHAVTLLLIALLTVASKAIIIPAVLRRIQFSMNIKRDLEFRYLTPIGSLLVSAVLVFLVYRLFSQYLLTISDDSLLLFGAVIGISLTLMGMLVIFTRRKMITKILGYLTMENGVLLFSLFIAELPFIVEVLIVIDLIMLIVLAAILAFGIDSTVEVFHEKLNSFTNWFRDE